MPEAEDVVEDPFAKAALSNEDETLDDLDEVEVVEEVEDVDEIEALEEIEAVEEPAGVEELAVVDEVTDELVEVLPIPSRMKFASPWEELELVRAVDVETDEVEFNEVEFPWCREAVSRSVIFSSRLPSSAYQQRYPARKRQSLLTPFAWPC